MLLRGRGRRSVLIGRILPQANRAGGLIHTGTVRFRLDASWVGFLRLRLFVRFWFVGSIISCSFCAFAFVVLFW